MRALSVPSMYLRASRALRYAERKGGRGTEFARFGRRLAVRLLRSRVRHPVVQLLIAPVSITRYFEFPFVLSHLPPRASECLDVSSPRLFSLFVARERPSASVTMINPDRDDAAITSTIVESLGISNVSVTGRDVLSLERETARYDCIWSISVVEHIGGEDGDIRAMRLMYNALSPGGRLIVTVPVDRRYWLEYRNIDVYGLGEGQTSAGTYFFQRFYDEASLQSRLLVPLSIEPTAREWFGERVEGTFHAYIARWLDRGMRETIDDPRTIVDAYQRYRSWQDMPGVGVCGLVIDKPVGGASGR